MAKYKHTRETSIVLDDLENRIIQLIEANSRYLNKVHSNIMINAQNEAFNSVLVLIRQVRTTGHIKRGTPVIADDIEGMVETKWNNRPQLGLSELMQKSLL